MVLVTIASGILLLSEPSVVERSPGLSTLAGIVETSTLQGIVVKDSESSVTTLVPWFELRGGMLPEGVSREYSDQALNAWRAHSRLARGDVSGAMPIYAQLSRTYLWKTGPQSLDVCSGMIHCLIGNEKRAQAVEPMLAMFTAVGEGETSQIAAFDQLTRLRTDLPPVFFDSASSIDHDRLGGLGDNRTRLIHAYFRLVMCEQSQREQVLDELTERNRLIRQRDAGLVLLEQMSFAQSHPNASKRQGARESLQRRAKTQQGTWTEVWARLALGAGMIRDEDPYIRDRGVIELVHIIVRLGDIDPGLTQLAAQITKQYLRDTGRAEWGAQLMQEAQTNMNSHRP